MPVISSPLFTYADTPYMTGLFPVFIVFGLASVLRGSLGGSLEITRNVSKHN